MKTRKIGDLAADLRKKLGHTQQSWANEMGWAISSTVRFEHGAVPGPKALSEMVAAAWENGLDDLALELQTHLNVALGPNFPITPDPTERYFVLIARRIFQNPKRHAAFLKFAAPEIEILKAENVLRKEHTDQLFSGLDAWNEREKAREKARRGETK
jgi:hypothetical protein